MRLVHHVKRSRLLRLDSEDSLMGNTVRLLAGSLLAASVVATPKGANGQGAAPAAAHPTAAGFRSPTAIDESRYSSVESDFVVGKTVYLRSSKMRYGAILAVDPNHSFPASFPRSHMKAVLIQRKDGPREWTPLERITRIYVVNR